MIYDLALQLFFSILLTTLIFALIGDGLDLHLNFVVVMPFDYRLVPKLSKSVDVLFLGVMHDGNAGRCWRRGPHQIGFSPHLAGISCR